MRVLVTGGLGFIGSHVVDALIAGGYKVDIVDNYETGKQENYNEGAVLYNYDIRDVGGLEVLFSGRKYEAVFHLAALARVPRSVEDPINTHNTNVTGTLNLLQMCRKYKVRKFIYSSSSSVYGMQSDWAFLMNETMPPKPLSPYAMQKLMGEQYGKLFSELFDLQVVALRYFNVYGPRQISEGAYSLVIGKFLEQKRQGKAMTINGHGTQTRAYTHVSDVVKANIKAFNWLTGQEHKEGLFQAVNIGTDKETSVKEIAELLGGEKTFIIPNPRGEFEEERKSADYTKAKIMFDWEPTVQIEDGIKELL